jgi:hypothetical protein
MTIEERETIREALVHAYGYELVVFRNDGWISVKRKNCKVLINKAHHIDDMSITELKDDKTVIADRHLLLQVITTETNQEA